MYICSLRMTTLRFFGVICLSVVTLVTLLALVPTYESAALIRENGKIVYTGADTQEGRIAFAGQFGWEVAAQSEEADEVIIPAVFDKTYAGYNAVQQAQGLNLEKYKGKTAERYVYQILNYPDYSGQVYLTLLVYNGKVIGGDVASPAMDGFLHGFEKKS